MKNFDFIHWFLPSNTTIQNTDLAQSHDKQGYSFNHKLGGAKTFLAMDNANTKTILGFYILTPASIEYARTPDIVRRGLDRYDVPVFWLARLAVDRKIQGQGLDGQLLLAADCRCLLASMEVGGIALLIDTKNDRVAKWYTGYVASGCAAYVAAAAFSDRGRTEGPLNYGRQEISRLRPAGDSAGGSGGHPFRHQLQVSLVVLIIKKCLLAPVAPLGHMVRHSQWQHSCDSYHLISKSNLLIKNCWKSGTLN